MQKDDNDVAAMQKGDDDVSASGNKMDGKREVIAVVAVIAVVVVVVVVVVVAIQTRFHSYYWNCR